MLDRFSSLYTPLYFSENDVAKASDRHMVLRSTSDDNMIVKWDANHLADFYETLRLRQIFIAWCGIATWMRVSDDYGSGSKMNCMAEYVAWMEWRRVEDTSKHKHRLTQKPPLRIEIEGKSILLLFVNADGQNLSYNVIRSFHRTFE